jgi:hypothetical protein
MFPWTETVEAIAAFIIRAIKKALDLDKEEVARAANTHYIHQLQVAMENERKARGDTDNQFHEKEKYWRKQFGTVLNKYDSIDRRCDDMMVTTETTNEIVNGLKAGQDARFSLIEHLINANEERLRKVEGSEILRLPLSEDEWKKIRALAHKNGLTVVQYVTNLIRTSG